MIIKQHLPFRYSREGFVPNRIVLQFHEQTAEICREMLLKTKKTAHFYLAENGCITAFTPLFAAANLLGPVGSSEPDTSQCAIPRGGILILIEGKDKKLSDEQKEPLIRLLKKIQKEVLRIYGERFIFSRESLCTDGDLPLEELLDLGNYQGEERTLFRVQTGSYRHRKDAEDSIERLQKAGIAAYISEVRQV